MGVKIGVESTLGKGSIFYFTLPYKEAIDGRINKLNTKEEEQQTKITPLVLIVEDNTVNQELTQIYLNLLDSEYHIACNGAEALEKVRQHTYDLILMDIQMPKMDGMAATIAIRAFNQQVPIVAMSAHALERERERCFEIGMNDYIAKPFKVEALKHILEKFIALPTQKQHSATPRAQHINTQELQQELAQNRFLKNADASISRELLQLFKNELDQLSINMERAIAAQDSWQIQRVMHKIKSNFQLLDLTKFYDWSDAMDRLAAELGLAPDELRLRTAMRTGDHMITGQEITGTAPAEECLRAAAEMPLPPVPAEADDDVMLLPGGAGRTADRGQVRRGVGYGLSIKNIAFSEGFDDSAAAACTLRGDVAIIKSACAEVGQGFVTIAGQIAREVLGVTDVVIDTADTDIGSAGSTSASRQTWMSGGAVEHACRGVRDLVVDRAAKRTGADPATLDLVDGRVVSVDGAVDLPLVDVVGDDELRHELVFRHAPTQPLDEDGQGDAHVSYAFAAHRAVVDVDPELGLVRVVQITTGQDVGRALNPVQVVGQIEGGIAQGVGLAVMEEIVVEDGLVKNASFTDYLIPTALDMPTVETALIEHAEPDAPFGAKGVGEPPTISSTPAVVAAIRDATGLSLPRVPVRPEDIAFGS